MQVEAVRNGWLPFYPQFDRSSIEVVTEAKAAGVDPVKFTVDQLKARKLKFSVEDPDAPENWPRVWFIWRGNALMSSAKGHEFFLKHYLGTHTNAIAEELAEGVRKGGRLARACAARKDGPGGGSQLPHGHLGAVLRYHPAGGDLVRESGPELDRHAQLHPSALGRRAALLGIEERLADLPRHRKEVQRACRAAFPRTGRRLGGVAAGARYSRRKLRSRKCGAGCAAKWRLSPARPCRT